jgi:hypothetical protein
VCIGRSKKWLACLNRCSDADVIKQCDPDEDNLLVEAIVKCLRRRLLNRSFYDKHDIKVGDNLNFKIGPACNNTFAFVQAAGNLRCA